MATAWSSPTKVLKPYRKESAIASGGRHDDAEATYRRRARRTDQGPRQDVVGATR